MPVIESSYRLRLSFAGGKMRAAIRSLVVLALLRPFAGVCAPALASEPELRRAGDAADGVTVFSTILSAASPAETLGRAGSRVGRAVATLHTEYDHDRALPGSPVTIIVRARDRWADLTDTGVTVSSDVGEVSAPVRIERGTYRAQLLLPTSLPAQKSASIVVRAGGITERSTLPIAAGPPASVTLEGPEALAADGAVAAKFLVRVADEFGNPVEAVPSLEATRGELRPAIQESPGYWTFIYRPRRLARDEDEVVHVRAADITATKSVRLVAPPTTLFVLGAKGGFVLASGRFRPTIGAEVSAWRRVAAEEVGIVLEGAWWNFGNSGRLQVPGGPSAFTGDQSYLPVTASLAWKRSLGSRATWGLSLGGGAARVSSTATLGGQPAISLTGWAPVATASTSLAWWVFGDEAFGEVRGGWIGDPHLATLSGSVFPVFLNVGYRFHAG
jgi:hypothetical protein